MVYAYRVTSGVTLEGICSNLEVFHWRLNLEAAYQDERDINNIFMLLQMVIRDSELEGQD